MSDFVSEVCRALAHPARRALLHALVRDECDVGNLGSCCGLDQPAVSKHLAALRGAGLVRVRVDGRRRCYSLGDRAAVERILDLLGQLEEAASGPLDGRRQASDHKGHGQA